MAAASVGSAPVGVTVKAVDMPASMRDAAVSRALETMVQGGLEREVAATLKKHFDAEFGPSWQCIVGKNFGSFVTHENQRFIYMYVGRVAVLLFKTAA